MTCFFPLFNPGAGSGGRQFLSKGIHQFILFRRKPAIVSDNQYPALAKSVMNGEIPGSFAGGEQPKFTAFCADSSSHVIVKFSPLGNNEIAGRWRDILITEYHAAKVIQGHNLPASETRLIEMDGRLFLESRRFDRSGEYGRMSMVSLQSIDAEFTGLGSTWPKVLDALFKKNLVSRQHVLDAECLWCFGSLINNTDMHLGNLSFAINDDVFSLLPIYDMCSMGFAPKSGGEVSPYEFVPHEPKIVNIDKKMTGFVKNMAHDFWDSVSKDNRISDEFKYYFEAGNPIDLM